MSWFARSITNTFNLDAEQRSSNNNNNNNKADNDTSTDPNGDDSPLSPGKGVKEDLSEITKTLTSKIWGVASFLAPPPPADQSNQQSDPESAAPERISGIRRDFAEIGGRFRSGIWKLSNNIDVSEITKLASNILQLSPDGDYYVSIGVTDEVLAFVRDVTMHPETWMDFPLLEHEYDSEDFELSDAQQEHALAVESLAPRLAALRIELCPRYMSESSFWKIYFVLLHPRLQPHAAELLSTPEIVKARASLTHELKAPSSVPSVTQPETVPLEISTTSLTTSVVSADTVKTEKHPIPTEEIEIVDKSVIQEEPSKTISNVVEDKDEDDWLKEDSSENVNISGATAVHVEDDEDVSFSDLEDDDEGDAPSSYRKPASRSDLSITDRAGQVSANNSEMKESSGWLDVDDIDFA